MVRVCLKERRALGSESDNGNGGGKKKEKRKGANEVV